METNIELDGTADPVEVTSLREGLDFVEEFGLPVGVWSSFGYGWEPQLAENREELLLLLADAMDVSPINEAALSRECD